MSRAGQIARRGAIVGVGLLVLAGLVLALAGERIYPRLLEVAARSGAGLAVSAQGPVSLQLWPTMGLSARELRVSPIASTPTWDAQLEQIHLEIAGISLLRGPLVIKTIEVRGAQVQVNRAGGAQSGIKNAIPDLIQTRIQIDDAQIDISGSEDSDRHRVQIDHYQSGLGTDGHPHLAARGNIDGSALMVKAQFSKDTQRIGNISAYPVTASVSVPDWKLQASLDGHVTDPLQGRGLALDTLLEIGDITPLVQFFELPQALSGSASLRTRVEGDLSSPRLVSVDGKLDGAEALSIKVKGTEIELSSAAIGSLQVQVDGPLPAGSHGASDVLRRVSAELSLKGHRGDYKVEVDHARFDLTGKTWFEARGSLELEALDDWSKAHSNLKLKASTASVARLAKLFDAGTLPELGPGQLRGQLSGALSSSTLKDMVLTIGSSKATRIVAKGKVGPVDLSGETNSMAAAKTDLRLEVSIDDGKVLQTYLGAGLATLKPWIGKGRIRGSPQNWRISDLDMTAGNKNDVRFDLTGEAKGRGGFGPGIKRVVTVSPAKDDTVDLKVVLETANAQATSRVIGFYIPELGALKGHGRFQSGGEEETLAVHGLSLQTTGELAMVLSGEIGSLNGMRDLDLELSLADTPPGIIDQLLDLELPLARDVSLKTRVRRPGQQELKVNGEVRVGSSRFDLELSAEHGAKIPLIKGRILSTSMHSSDFWPAVKPAANPKLSKMLSTSKGLGPLGIVPGLDFVLQDSVEEQQRTDAQGTLPWSRLRYLDIDLQIHVDKVQGVKINGGPLDLRLVDRDGRLEFGPAKIVFKEGSVSLHGIADSNPKPPTVEAKGSGVRLPVEELIANTRMKPNEMAGLLSFDYDLHSSGHNLTDLRANLDGTIRSLVEHGQFPLRSLDMLSGSLLDWLGSWLDSDQETPVPCLVTDFTISAGLAKADTLYARTENSAAYGIGEIDLRNDTLDVTITPKVKGLSLTPPATIRLHGALASPQLEVANASAVGLRYGAEVTQSALFPPSILLHKLFSHVSKEEPGPCR